MPFLHLPTINYHLHPLYSKPFFNLCLLLESPPLLCRIGAEPDESYGDPAARVLALHQPAGETYPPADPGDLTPQ